MEYIHLVKSGPGRKSCINILTFGWLLICGHLIHISEPPTVCMWLFIWTLGQRQPCDTPSRDPLFSPIIGHRGISVAPLIGGECLSTSDHRVRLPAARDSAGFSDRKHC